MDRNLVLLLDSGHTVKIALQPDDLPAGKDYGVVHAGNLVSDLRSVVVTPLGDPVRGVAGHVVMAFIEDMERATADSEPKEFQRIDVYSPGEAL